MSRDPLRVVPERVGGRVSAPMDAVVALERAEARIEQLEAELVAMADKRDAWKRAAEKAERKAERTSEGRLFPGGPA